MEQKDYGIVLDVIRLHHSKDHTKERRLIHQKRFQHFFVKEGYFTKYTKPVDLNYLIGLLTFLSKELLEPYGYTDNTIWFSDFLQQYRLSYNSPLINALQLEHRSLSLPKLIHLPYSTQYRPRRCFWKI